MNKIKSLKYKGIEIKPLIKNLYINSNIIIKDFDYIVPNFKKPIEYNCQVCNEKYKVGNVIKEEYRKICKKHHFFYICDYCGIEFEIKNLSDFGSNPLNKRYCSRTCANNDKNKSDIMRKIVSDMDKDRANKNLKEEQTCIKCKNKFKSIFKMDICNACITKETNKNNFLKNQVCEKCGKIFHSPFIMKICQNCNPNMHPSNFIVKDNVPCYKNIPLEILYQKLLSGEYNIYDFPNFDIRYKHVCYKGKDILSNKFLSLIGLFHIIDGIKYYKQIPVEELSEKILSGEYNINDFPNFNIRFENRVCYGNEDIITGDLYIFDNSNFYNLDGVLYIYDKSIKDYIPFDYFTEKYSDNNFENVQDFLDKIRIDYPNAFIQQTYRLQNSDCWSSSFDAFELDLNQKEIGYYAYIKFCYKVDENGNIINNQIFPSVGGKTGSYLVNSNGSDVNFSEKEEDGPTRKMIKDGICQWVKTYILIIPSENEEKALLIEKEIQNKYNLLGS